MCSLVVVIIIKKNMLLEAGEEEMHNDMLCCRLNSPVLKRKRKEMESSTPISGRREPLLIELEEDSPINVGDRERSANSDESVDMVPTSKVKAGLSNEIDTMSVTPVKEFSSDTMDKRLALHCADIVNSSKHNANLAELREQVPYILPLAENSFAKRSDGNAVEQDDVQAVGVEGMNNPQPEEGVEAPTLDANSAVGVDGMNKPLPGGGVELSTMNGAVGMDEMNKTPERGGVFTRGSDTTVLGLWK